MNSEQLIVLVDINYILTPHYPFLTFNYKLIWKCEIRIEEK